MSLNNSLIFISYEQKMSYFSQLVRGTYRLKLICRPRSNNHSLFVGNGLLTTCCQILTGFIRVSIRYSTIETKEATRIGNNGFLFPHEYSGESREVRSTKAVT